MWHQFQEAMSCLRVVRYTDRTRDRLIDVRDRPAEPAPDFVAKEAQDAGKAAPDRAFGDHTSPRVPLVWGGGDLDHEAPVSKPNLETGVVEIERRTALEQGLNAFIGLAVEAHETAAARRPRAKRKPVEVNGCGAEYPPKADLLAGLPRGNAHELPPISTGDCPGRAPVVDIGRPVEAACVRSERHLIPWSMPRTLTKSAGPMTNSAKRRAHGGVKLVRARMRSRVLSAESSRSTNAQLKSVVRIGLIM
jgi:hypothetical protein